MARRRDSFRIEDFPQKFINFFDPGYQQEMVELREKSRRAIDMAQDRLMKLVKGEVREVVLGELKFFVDGSLNGEDLKTGLIVLVCVTKGCEHPPFEGGLKCHVCEGVELEEDRTPEPSGDEVEYPEKVAAGKKKPVDGVSFKKPKIIANPGNDTRVIPSHNPIPSTSTGAFTIKVPTTRKPRSSSYDSDFVDENSPPKKGNASNPIVLNSDQSDEDDPFVFPSDAAKPNERRMSKLGNRDGDGMGMLTGAKKTSSVEAATVMETGEMEVEVVLENNSKKRTDSGASAETYEMDVQEEETNAEAAEITEVAHRQTSSGKIKVSREVKHVAKALAERRSFPF